ncbi:MAG: hypothetical protein ABI867_37325 [Kofleriaceae bacterium]
MKKTELQPKKDRRVVVLRERALEAVTGGTKEPKPPGRTVWMWEPPPTS